MSRLSLARRTVWSREGRAAVEAAARAHRADVVHFHNTLPLVSPAGYSGARAAGAAVVQTVHNFRLVCPSATLFRDGHVCESCVGRAFALPGVVHGCYRGSRAATLAVATATAVHRALGTWDRAVDRYVALTPFMRDTLVRGGYPAARIAVKANALRAMPARAARGGGYALFAGRLDEGKGVELLVRAWEGAPGLPPLVVAGDGPLAPLVRAAAERLGPARLQFVGWQAAADLATIRDRADAFVFPSEWYEGSPISFVESLAAGLPAVASDLPTVRGMVRDGVEGRLFATGDADALAAAVRDVFADAGRRARMGDAGRRTAERDFAPEGSLVALRGIYAEALATRHAAHV
jgi:glycosyltransferase involved in cell wall biosynthesis